MHVFHLHPGGAAISDKQITSSSYRLAFQNNVTTTNLNLVSVTELLPLHYQYIVYIMLCILCIVCPQKGSTKMFQDNKEILSNILMKI